MKKECKGCIWYNQWHCTDPSKAKDSPECIINSALNKATEELIYKEYNTNTSVRHLEQVKI